MQVNHATVAGPNDAAKQVSKNVWEDDHIISGAPLSVDVNVSNAELLALHTTPKTLVAAPGAGLIIVPTMVIGSFSHGSNHFTTSDSSPTIGYGVSGWNPFNGSIFVHNEFEDSITYFDLDTVGSTPSGEVINRALVLAAVGTLTGGAGSTLKVHVEYVIVGS